MELGINIYRLSTIKMSPVKLWRHLVCWVTRLSQGLVTFTKAQRYRLWEWDSVSPLCFVFLKWMMVSLFSPNTWLQCYMSWMFCISRVCSLFVLLSYSRMSAGVHSAVIVTDLQIRGRSASSMWCILETCTVPSLSREGTWEYHKPGERGHREQGTHLRETQGQQSVDVSHRQQYRHRCFGSLPLNTFPTSTVWWAACKNILFFSTQGSCAYLPHFCSTDRGTSRDFPNQPAFLPQPAGTPTYSPTGHGPTAESSSPGCYLYQAPQGCFL